MKRENNDTRKHKRKGVGVGRGEGEEEEGVTKRDRTKGGKEEEKDGEKKREGKEDGGEATYIEKNRATMGDCYLAQNSKKGSRVSAPGKKREEAGHTRKEIPCK